MAWPGGSARPGGPTDQPASEHRWRLGHRPALDGLRGLAILVVLADHSGISFAARGGQLGVTVFFVLSGFLITTLLLEERARYGRVSLRSFYARRALRLLPALVVLLVAVAAVMAVSGRADEIIGDVLPTLFYYMNWSQVSGNNPGLLSHVWSLSIEEQFYLAWPVLMLGSVFLGRGHLRLTAILLIGLTLAAMALRVVLWSGPASYYRVFNGRDTRMDALAVGCLAALALSYRPIRVPGTWMVLLAAAIPPTLWMTDNQSMAFAGLAVTAVLAAVLVAGAASGAGERILGWRPLVFIGVISYGLYLWHRPVMKVFTQSGLGGVPWAVALMVAISFGLAILSRRLIEEPFLRMKSRFNRGS